MGLGKCTCRILAAALVLGLGSGCDQKKVDMAHTQVYAGPVLSAKDVVTHYSDSARTKVILRAPIQWEYQDGDREFPKGIQIDFYDEQQRNSTRLTARYARYERTQDIYVAKEDVVVTDLIEHKVLNTEELRWSRPKAKVYTDKFVRVSTQKELLTGIGLEAAQDFSWYRILQPTAETQQEAL